MNLCNDSVGAYFCMELGEILANFNFRDNLKNIHNISKDFQRKSHKL
jgi:hypothetical protein